MADSQQSATHYVHEVMRDPSNQIRLLTLLPTPTDDEIACELQIWNRHEAPTYAAISYVWGDPKDPETITINGRPFEVGQNCRYALWQARHPGYVTLWIDAICINQSLVSEKSIQVERMYDTYKDASAVLACIGAHDDSSRSLYNQWLPFIETQFHDLDVKEVHLYGKQHGRIQAWASETSVQTLHELNKAISLFSKRPYWSRLWILQELCANARERVHVLCAGSSAQYRSVRILTGMFQRAEIVLQEDTTQKLKSVVECYELMACTDLTNASPFASDNIPWDILMGFQCSDVRDRVFGILGLVRWTEAEVRIVPDYGKTAVGVLYDMIPICNNLLHDRASLQSAAGALGLSTDTVLGQTESLRAIKMHTWNEKLSCLYYVPVGFGDGRRQNSNIVAGHEQSGMPCSDEKADCVWLTSPRPGDVLLLGNTYLDLSMALIVDERLELRVTEFLDGRCFYGFDNHLEDADRSCECRSGPSIDAELILKLTARDAALIACMPVEPGRGSLGQTNNISVTDVRVRLSDPDCMKSAPVLEPGCVARWLMELAVYLPHVASPSLLALIGAKDDIP